MNEHYGNLIILQVIMINENQAAPEKQLPGKQARIYTVS